MMETNDRHSDQTGRKPANGIHSLPRILKDPFWHDRFFWIGIGLAIFWFLLFYWLFF